MKIAYIYTAILEYGGVDRIITMKANYLADKLGHEVYIITDSQHGKPTAFPLSDKVTHIDLDISFYEEYKYHLFRRYFVYKKLMKEYEQKMRETLYKIRPDIVCTTCGRDLDFLTDLDDGSKKIGESHIAKKYFRKFHLLEQRGFPYNTVALYWRRKQEKSIKKLDTFVVLTQRDAENWADITQATVIPNPYTINPSTTSPCTNKKIISVGRLVEQKSYERLIEAWSAIAAKYPDWQVHIYGDGELRAQLIKEVDKRNVGKSLFLMPPTKHIEEKYLNSSFFVMSSKFEGLPLVLLEAMRCGLPCVSFDCPYGPRELIKDGYNGILVENGNIKALTEAIERLINNEKERIEMGKNAYAFSDQFSFDNIMKKWEKLFHETLNTEKILFLIYHGFSDYSGITKKIQYQVKGLRELGYDVRLCTYDFDKDGHRVRYIDGEPIEDYGKGNIAGLKSKYKYDSIVEYVRKNHINFVYARSYHNANPFTIRMFREFEKMGVKSVIEVPTYPYDQEYDGSDLKSKVELQTDKLFRRSLAKHTDAIVTFSNAKEIFGQRVINISNGIDFDAMPLRHHTKSEGEVNFLAVAEVHYWHGFDRFIAGIGEYYKNGGKRKLKFHIVGGINPIDLERNSHAPGFDELVRQYGIRDNIIYHGTKFGDELNKFFDMADFAVGSLARHRSGITDIKTLKNREYAVRGIPFIYSETDDDFEKMPYILKAPADETPIDIEKVLQFYDSLTITPEEIRSTVGFLSWKNQMKRVIDQL